MIAKVSVYTICLYAFLFAIIVIRLPNIYFLPFVTSGLFTTQAIARGILIALFLVGFFLFRQKSLYASKNNRIVVILLLLFLLSSSLSLIWAQNVEAFFSRYKDVVIGILSFFVFGFFIRDMKKIVIALLIPIPFNIFYQFLLLYGKSMFLFLEGIIYQKHFDLVSYNLYRGRLYIDVYDEAFISLMVVLLQTKRKAQISLVGIGLILLASLAFLSNFRTRILMLVLGLVSSFVVLQKITMRKILSLLFFLVVISFVISFISSFRYGYTLYDRFFLSSIADIRTVFSRYEQVENALAMGFVSPFGVGLGNYYDTLITQRGVYYAYLKGNSDSTAYQYIHNNFAGIIAESGYISFLIYTLLLVKFFLMDRKILSGKDRYKKAFVISFWVLFFFGLFNPPIPGSYQILFWGIRGLLVENI